MMKRLALALALVSTPVAAQTVFPTPNASYQATGVVQMCLNASGQAVPTSSGACANASSGTATTANQGTAGTAAWPVAQQGSALAAVGITPTIVTATTSLIAKSSAGNMYGAYAYNTSATASFLVTINAAAVPAAGATVAPVECVPLPASGSATVNYGAGPPDAYATGIVILISTSCTTYTAGGSSFIKARVR